MSRYGRISEADKLDRYYTPRWPVELLIEHWPRLEASEVVGEPCAGQGHIASVLEGHGLEVIGSDIDPEAPYPQLDATDDEMLMRYQGIDCIVTNPPYSSSTGTAFEMLDSLQRLNVPIAMLVRLSFLEPPKQGDRKACYRNDAGSHMPSEVVVLPRVQYSGPMGGDDNPATSCWVIWNGRTAPPTTTMTWYTSEDRERIKGQTSLLEDV